MCGISGEVRFDTQPVEVERLEKMNAALVLRGPDDGGIFSLGSRGFAHRRLKIMDLSLQSQQPMLDVYLGLGVVFNGALYNHRALRAELELMGYRFFSSGDTEVILKAYHAWGIDGVKRFDGMFAFALWERDSGKTILCRDRLGIKPLYFTHDARRLRFASTLPALLAAGDVDTHIDPRALNFYLNFHAVVPAPYTILSGIQKLPPASYAVLEPDGRLQTHSYWSLSFMQQDTASLTTFEAYQEALLEALRAAVRRRLVAAVDVGVLLSGGVDSSLLVGLMAEAGVERLKTYSVGFETVNGLKGDEFTYSDLVARHFDTDHHKISVSSEALLSALPDAITAMSEPMVSHDCIGFYLLSQAVSRTCRAVQSGQGADEVFGGYHWYRAMASSAPFESYRKAFFDRDYNEYQKTVSAEYGVNDIAGQFVQQHFDAIQTPCGIDKALHLDTTVMLVDDPVKRVDNMTMAWGLEARVPYLDHHLVEFAAQIPADFKVSGEGKMILKEAARSVIPAAVIDRPKGYFPVPALTYLRGHVLTYVQDALTNAAAQKRGLFQRAYLNRLLSAPEEHITPLRGSKLWQLGLLELWLQSMNI